MFKLSEKKEKFIENIFSGAGDVVNSLTGQTGARAASEAAALQAGAGREAITSLEEARATGIEAVTGAEERALGFLDPFSGVGADIAQQGLGDLQQLDPSGLDFLTDPQAQFDFLQNNPLFQLSLENANRQTGARAASGGRLSAGDTLSQLSNNVLLSSQPLIDRQSQGLITQRGDQRQNILNQRQDQFNQLGFGANIAGQQAQIPQTAAANIANISTGTGINIADLLTSIGASQAGGVVGGANARSGGVGNLLNIAGLIGGFGGFGGGSTTPQLQ